jgi:hypothetical protein
MAMTGVVSDSRTETTMMAPSSASASNAPTSAPAPPAAVASAPIAREVAITTRPKPKAISRKVPIAGSSPTAPARIASPTVGRPRPRNSASSASVPTICSTSTMA